jgi:hypothetical protein
MTKAETKAAKRAAVAVAIQDMTGRVWQWIDLERLLQERHGKPGFSQSSILKIVNEFPPLAKFSGGGGLWRTESDTC